MDWTVRKPGSMKLNLGMYQRVVKNPRYRLLLPEVWKRGKNGIVQGLRRWQVSEKFWNDFFGERERNRDWEIFYHISQKRVEKVQNWHSWVAPSPCKQVLPSITLEALLFCRTPCKPKPSSHYWYFSLLHFTYLTPYCHIYLLDSSQIHLFLFFITHPSLYDHNFSSRPSQYCLK